MALQRHLRSTMGDASIMESHQEPWVIRTMLSVPGHIERLIRKGAKSKADCVMLDLQDAVPPESKTEARTTIRRALDSGLLDHKTVMVRLNHLDTGMTQRDVDTVACEQLSGFVYPMANTVEEIEVVDAMLARQEIALGLAEGHFSIIVLVETPLGVINAYPLAKASGRVIGLLFGAEDFVVEMEARPDAEQLVLHTPRALIALAARAAGVEAIDTPYVQVHDLDGLEAHANRGRSLGMSGMLVISPRQIPIARAVYTPSQEEVQEAKEVLRLMRGSNVSGRSGKSGKVRRHSGGSAVPLTIQASATSAEEAGRSYAIRDGRLVAPSREKQARRVLLRAAAANNLDLRSSRTPAPQSADVADEADGYRSAPSADSGVQR